MADEDINHGDASSVSSSSLQNEDVEDSRDGGGHIAEGSPFLMNTEVQPNDQVIPGSTGSGFAQASNASAGPSLKRSASQPPLIIYPKVRRIRPSVQASAQASPSAISPTQTAPVPPQSQTAASLPSLARIVDYRQTSSWPRGLPFQVQNPATSPQFLSQTVDYRQTSSLLRGTGLPFRVQIPATSQFLPRTFDYHQTSSWLRGTGLPFLLLNPATSPQFLSRAVDYCQTPSWPQGTGLPFPVQNSATSPQFLLQTVDYHQTSFWPHGTGLPFQVQNPATSAQFLPQANDCLQTSSLPYGLPFRVQNTADSGPSSSQIVSTDFFQTSSQTPNFPAPVQIDRPPSPLLTESTPRISQDLNQPIAPIRGECFLCHRDLSLPPEEPIIWSILRPAPSVFPCYHHFHVQCLEVITLTDQSEYPPCIQCQVDEVQSSSSSQQQQVIQID